MDKKKCCKNCKFVRDYHSFQWCLERAQTINQTNFFFDDWEVDWCNLFKWRKGELKVRTWRGNGAS